MNTAKKPLCIASTSESESDFVMLPGSGDPLIIVTDSASISISQPREKDGEEGLFCALLVENSAGTRGATLDLPVLAQRLEETIVDFAHDVLAEIEDSGNRFKLPVTAGGIWISVPFGVVHITQGYDVYDAAYTQVEVFKTTTVDLDPFAVVSV